MSTFSLDWNDSLDHNYRLIGIHTSLEDYRLAFLLNKFFNIKLKKKKNGLLVNKKKNTLCYSLYQYYDLNTETEWSLLSNNSISFSKVGFFDQTENKISLIQESKNVDFFLKIDGVFHSNKKMNINKIPQIITSYPINPNTLKSKDFLIF